MGKETEIDVSRHELCNECGGIGTKDGLALLSAHVWWTRYHHSIAGVLFHKHHLSEMSGERDGNYRPV